MKMTKWEYTTAAGDDACNELGAKGWEAYGISPNGATKLKRPKGYFIVEERNTKTGEIINENHVEETIVDYER